LHNLWAVARVLKGCDFIVPCKWRALNDDIARTNASAARLETPLSAFCFCSVLR